MKNYILLKLTEMALRAINVPKNRKWVFKAYIGNEAFLYDKIPASIEYRIDYDTYLLIFQPNTTELDISYDDITVMLSGRFMVDSYEFI